jgi:hypothetical protein
MGWGFGGFKFRLPKLNKHSLLGLGVSGGGVLPGIGEAFAGSDKAENAIRSVIKPLGNMVTGGYFAQKEATEEAKEARNQARDQYATSQAEAEAEAKRIANMEEERKRRLLLYGTQNPSTLLGTYTGLPGQANVGRPTLG